MIAGESFVGIARNKYYFVQCTHAHAEREVLRPLGKGLTSVEMSDVRRQRRYVPPLLNSRSKGAGAPVGCFAKPL